MQIIPLKLASTGGAITTSNLDEFEEQFSAALSAINTDLQTDDDFAEAETDIKTLDGISKGLSEAREALITGEIRAVSARLEAMERSADEIRLRITKLVKSRKEAIKGEIVAEAMESLVCVKQYRSRYALEVNTAIKGKRTIQTIRDAAKMAVSMVNGRIAKTRAVIADFVAEHGQEMVMDSDRLELDSAEVVAIELRRRWQVAEAMRETAEAHAIREVNQIIPPPTPMSVVPEVKPDPLFSEEPVLLDVPATVPTEAEESAWWLDQVMQAFGALKVARERLYHDRTKQAASAFGEAVNAGFKAMKGALK
jgi:hypothetical protein